MSKGNSNLYKGTKGFFHALREDTYERFFPNGSKVIDFSKLPGKNGIAVKKRLSDEQMAYLTNEYGIEFAQVYELGPGKKGSGGVYKIYSGDTNSVLIPINSRTILINHTHPGGTAYPSSEDLDVLDYIKQAGSPQRTSSIIPLGKSSIKFKSKGVK